ncbi:hypothetical protein CC1G_04543 [Coprinopsis cinerea okayama7|uniref:DUF803 domain-containing protein n=1 Tax=Coprinopsis cinerea (strain Okayama-7 / 130 / ATCC MYA-4618 / FGSC 9003) TaxID=240176 RepID=A8N5G5_COPC7|nr:hypothetical protein CC1G_04543 [Coprinopsis cinerea okayama7\|eukprot:XP_001830110.2 hypothetical protein CC1G_04543 [Coprinopsis cinerea okayama7\
MDPPINSTATTTLDAVASASASPIPVRTPGHGHNPVVAFMIGLSIILLASIMNAAGLNLTKYDHVRMSALPKSERRKDWMRPIWLLGMLLYILSQLIGSTLALEYMRAEYVAPLGSSSLVFNFLFARFLVGTPVTKSDIWGTIVVVLGVIGIVAFGSINSGLSQETDAAHLTELWRRGGWLGYFFFMGGALYLVLVFTSCLDAVLAARGDLNNTRPATGQRPTFGSAPAKRLGFVGKVVGFFKTVKAMWDWGMSWIMDWVEHWAGPKDDKQIAWTLGIGWACCGGGLAGGCLVFAKATVKLISGSLSKVNTGNQFGHASSIFTIIFLAITAVMQILCLNRGLRVYDSTLVVPVFYGVYTATGFLNSLIFNNEVESYQSWTLFLIFVSISVLVSGVVLLTHKKPEPVTTRIRGAATPRTGLPTSDSTRRRRRTHLPGDADDEEMQMHTSELAGKKTGESERLWAVGEVSDSDEGDDPDIDHHLHPMNRSPLQRRNSHGHTNGSVQKTRSGGDSEVTGLMAGETEEDDGDAADREDSSSDPEMARMKDKVKGKGKGKVGRRRSMDPFRDEGVDEESELEVFGMSKGDQGKLR